jgi:hypothetical protein
MARPEELIAKAKKVFGLVAETVGKDILKKFGDNDFEKNYVDELARISGNRSLIENILRK